MAFMSVAEVASMSDAQKSFRITPLQDLFWVTASDISTYPTDYLVGCEGQIKELVEYADYNRSQVASRTKYFYRNATFPSKISTIEVRNI